MLRTLRHGEPKTAPWKPTFPIYLSLATPSNSDIPMPVAGPRIGYLNLPFMQTPPTRQEDPRPTFLESCFEGQGSSRRLSNHSAASRQSNWRSRTKNLGMLVEEWLRDQFSTFSLRNSRKRQRERERERERARLPTRDHHKTLPESPPRRAPTSVEQRPANGLPIEVQHVARLPRMHEAETRWRKRSKAECFSPGIE